MKLPSDAILNDPIKTDIQFIFSTKPISKSCITCIHFWNGCSKCLTAHTKNMIYW